MRAQRAIDRQAQSRNKKEGGVQAEIEDRRRGGGFLINAQTFAEPLKKKKVRVAAAL